MRITVTAPLAALLAAAVVATGRPIAAQEAPLPDRNSFMAKVRGAIRIDQEVQQNFNYVERRRDVKFSALGKVSVGPLRTFEVFPSAEPGRTYKRLIAIDGQPLDPDELRRRDAEHARDLDKEMRRQQRETPAQRAQRLERFERERNERRAILEDALDVFEATVLAREIIDGEPTIVVALTPRPNVRVDTREGNWMKQFSGRAWFVEHDGQFARFDMQASDDVAIGWGLIGRLHKGSHLLVERRRVGHTWLPARLTFTATGKTLLFRAFELDVRTEYGEYREK